jgi:hypothetical protein
MRHIVALTLFAVLATAPSRGSAQAAAPTPGAILHFPSRDSVEFINAGPMYLATGQPGFIFAFHPFQALDDSTRLRALAGEIWRWLLPQLDSTPSFVVLQATSLRAHPTLGVQAGHGRNLVLERRADGKWYFVDETRPAQ